MKVEVKLYGTLRRLSKSGTPGKWVGELPEDSSIAELIAHLGTRKAEVAVAAINDKVVDFSATIPPNSTIILVTNVNGG